MLDRGRGVLDPRYQSGVTKPRVRHRAVHRDLGRVGGPGANALATTAPATRRHSASAAAGSGRWLRQNPAATRSNDRSRNGRRAASPSTAGIPGERCRSIPAAASEASVSRARAAAAASAATPVPAPTSRTATPGIGDRAVVEHRLGQPRVDPGRAGRPGIGGPVVGVDASGGRHPSKGADLEDPPLPPGQLVVVPAERLLPAELDQRADQAEPELALPPRRRCGRRAARGPRGRRRCVSSFEWGSRRQLIARYQARSAERRTRGRASPSRAGWCARRASVPRLSTSSCRAPACSAWWPAHRPAAPGRGSAG